MTGTTIDDLIQLLSFSDTILKTNSVIEDSIRQNGGTVIYSYNNIIIASEISESFYNSLLTNTNISFIQDVPLKKYGDVDTTLIDQLDVNTIFSGEDNPIISTGVTTVLTIDGISGSTNKSNVTNVDTSTNTSSTISSIGIAPTIMNSTFTLTATTNTQFQYYLLASGSTPITFSLVVPSNYSGDLFISSNNMLTGKTNNIGVYNIILKATNNYGIDSKTLVLSVSEITKITNTNLVINNKIGSNFTYNITSSGALPKTYDVINLPSGVTLTGSLISGVFSSVGTYNMIMSVTGGTGSDSSNLTVNVGSDPTITSSGVISSEVNSGFTYIITSTISSGVTYSMSGSLPKGLVFSVDTINGTPTQTGSFTVKLIASNVYGQSTKSLNITIYRMGG